MNNIGTNNACNNLPRRILLIDTFRGILIILVVVYHLLYDLDMIFGVNTQLFGTKWLHTFRDCFVSALIFISGISCNLSRNNLKRGVTTLVWGVVISTVTYIFMPSELIIFGILHFFGTAMIIWGLFEKFIAEIIAKISPPVGAIVAFFLYFATFNIYDLRFDGISEINIILRYFLFIVGFDMNISSADYYPILPWIMIFLAGAFAGRNIKTVKLPEFFYKNLCPPLTFIGQHTLIIYILHQPLIYGMLYVFFTLI